MRLVEYDFRDRKKLRMKGVPLEQRRLANMVKKYLTLEDLKVDFGRSRSSA